MRVNIRSIEWSICLIHRDSRSIVLLKKTNMARFQSILSRPTSLNHLQFPLPIGCSDFRCLLRQFSIERMPVEPASYTKYLQNCSASSRQLCHNENHGSPLTRFSFQWQRYNVSNCYHIICKNKKYNYRRNKYFVIR